MLVALVLARRERAPWFAGLATCASVAGGLGGYFLGARVFVGVMGPLLDSYGLMNHIDTVARSYAENALLALGTSGYTPIPYMLYTTMAGAAQLPLPTFVVGSFIGRALKYGPIALLAWLLGPRVPLLLRRYAVWAALLMAGLILLVVFF